MLAVTLGLLLGVPLSGSMQDPRPQPQDSRNTLTFGRVAAPVPTLMVTSTAFAGNAAIPERHSGYSTGPSPQLSWSGAPGGTKTFVVVMEDPDAKAVAPEPFVHWIVYNIPSATTALPEGVPATGDIKGGGMQGVNGANANGYFGPRPPAGDPEHHYHFEVFALDAELPLKAGANRSSVIAAMQGRVLAWGELVGTYKR
jgi:Raf kinase inhibitor-like YbhB/YbcL family protein